MKDSDENLNSDFDYSREVYYDLIEKGREALERMTDVADETAHPRSYEVLSGMIKNISDVNDRLMDLQRKKKEIKQIGRPAKFSDNKQIGQTTNMIITTDELQRMLISQQQDEIIDVSPTEEDND